MALGWWSHPHSQHGLETSKLDRISVLSEPRVRSVHPPGCTSMAIFPKFIFLSFQQPPCCFSYWTNHELLVLMSLSNITWCSFCVKVNMVNLQECQFCNYKGEKKKQSMLQIWPYHEPGDYPSIGHCLSESHIFLMCQMRKITLLPNFTSASCKSKWFMCQSFTSQKGAHVKRPALQRKEQIRKQKTWLLGFAG